MVNFMIKLFEGLKIEDLISSFGDINFYNFKDLKSVANYVSEKILKEIQIIILRKETKINKNNEYFIYKNENYSIHELTLIPKKWQGVGVLGFENIFFLFDKFLNNK